MTVHNEDYYLKLSLPSIPPYPNSMNTKPYNLQKYQESETEQHLRDIISHISNRSNREKLKDGFNKVILAWTEKHDALIQAVEDLEKTKKRLQYRLNIQSQYFERSLKETQQYKNLYENCCLTMKQHQRSNSNNSSNNRRRSLLISSNSSCLSGKSFMSSSSARSSSCASSIRNSLSYVDEIMDPILFDHQLLVDSDNEDTGNEFDIYSVFSESELCALPISPNMTPPVMSPLSIKSTSHDSSEHSSEGLVFDGNETFWNTIANSKSNKSEVDTLISNYLRQGGNPNIAKSSSTVKSVKEGYGLIHALIAIKNTAALQKVIDAGAKTNVCPLTSKRENRITPLVLAAKLGYMNGVRLLLERGNAELMNARGPYGENALHAAVQSESDELVGYLLRLCKNKLLEKVDNNGATPLHYACITGRTRLITLFIRDCQTSPSPKDNKGETPLHYAVRNRKLKVIAKLVGELSVDPNPYILNQVPTPLDLAKSGGLKTIAEYLKRVGAKTTKQLEKASIK